MIYFIRDEATRLIKIGFTAGDGEERRRELQTGCPGKLVLLLQMEGSKQEETAWHERFADDRDRGEWFRPETELLLAITEAKVSQLETENARLQATLDAERERLSVARRRLQYLPHSPIGVCISKPEKSPLQLELEDEKNARARTAIVIEEIKQMLDGSAS